MFAAITNVMQLCFMWGDHNDVKCIQFRQFSCRHCLEYLKIEVVLRLKVYISGFKNIYLNVYKDLILSVSEKVPNFFKS